MTSIRMEFYMFLVSVLLGIASGLLFDLQRVWRRIVHPGRLGQNLGDMAFLLVAGGGITLGLFLTTWGERRVYLMLGLVSGAAAYFYLASPAVRRGLEGAACALKRVARNLLNLLKRVGRPLRPVVLRLRRLAVAIPRQVRSWWKKLPGFL